MRLIHCADLHLDSPLEANLSGARARERARELRESFLRTVRYAADEGVQAILIAGDLFDRASVRGSTLKFFLDTLRAYPNIDFFYLSGNHDRDVCLSDGGEPPQNLYTFGDGWRQYDLGEVVITGSEAPNEDTLSLDRERCNLVLLHGQDRPGAGQREPDVIRLGALRGKGIDYLALGHIHSYRVLPLDERGVAVYSGCPEGRGFDECGECGFVLLETEGRRVRYQFVPFARRTLYTVEADVSEVQTHAELIHCAERAVEGISESSLVKLVLTGMREDGLILDVEGIEAMLSERFYFGKVRDESKRLIRAEDFAHDATLRGAFVRRVLAADMDEDLRERVIACGLRALAGEELGV